uniref:Pseudouridine synthase RsuA/RluA-like domain-containing protein n=1 Tax=Corethron hystrix TaxID=216773 RepID=A0A7S1BDA4_9STRA|mmetsp:Transcript_22919/g.52502  ORF Transcript_22919/g.52502 Transcript_22919/m.52502 type:complete len:437 (+) Transcript_22919:63-1373(+)
MTRRDRSPSEARKLELAAKRRRISAKKEARRGANEAAKIAQRWNGWQDAVFCDEGGVQRVAPYSYRFEAFAKGRWFGRTAVDVLTDEFKAYSPSYFREALKSGRVLVNERKVDDASVFASGDQLVHICHRHEPPVRNELRVVRRDEERIVVDKPSSLPVHPCGRYRFNSVVYVLSRTHKVQALPVHRLDRLTSGVLVLALNASAARSIGDQIQAHTVSKHYLARVKGEFPLQTATKSEGPALFSSFEVPSEIIVDQNPSWVLCDEPLVCVNKRVGKFDVGAGGKESRTEFRRLSYNGRTSVVLCRPLTGRTHQIRVHLRALGFPIANDPSYGGKLCRGNTVLETRPCDAAVVDAFERRVRAEVDEICPECSHNNEQYIPADPHTKGELYCSEIWLHAICYAGDGWSESVPPPSWAMPDFDDENYLKDVDPNSLEPV